MRALADAQRERVLEMLKEDSGEQLDCLLDCLLGLAPSSVDHRPPAELGWTNAQAKGHDGYEAYAREIALQNFPMTPALEMLYLAPRMHALLLRGLETSDFAEFAQVRSRVLQLLEHDPWLADPRIPYTCGPQGMPREKPLLCCGLLAPGLQVIDERDLPLGDLELLPASLVRHEVIRHALAADVLLGGWHNGFDVRSNNLTKAMHFVVSHCDVEFLPEAMDLDPDSCRARLDSVMSQAIQPGDDGLVGRTLLLRIADAVDAGGIDRANAGRLVSLTTLRTAFEDFYGAGDSSVESLESFHHAVESICRVRESGSPESRSGADFVAGLPKSRYWGLLIDVSGTEFDPFGNPGRTLMEYGPQDFWSACMERLLADGLGADSEIEIQLDRSTTQRTTVNRAIQEGLGDTAAAIFQSLVTYKTMGQRIALGRAAEPVDAEKRLVRRTRII